MKKTVIHKVDPYQGAMALAYISLEGYKVKSITRKNGKAKVVYERIEGK